MTSTIVFDTIDETFPEAGKDNNSQGFRDNFAIIKDGLNTASSEITILQNNTAKKNEDNDFNGVDISNAVFVNNTSSVQNLSTQSTNFTIYADEADMYYGTVTGGSDMIITFDNWPEAPRYRVIRLILKSAGTQKNIRFAGGAMRYSSNIGLVSGVRTVVVSTDLDSTYHIEVSSYDNGDTIFVNYLAGMTA